MSGGWSSSAWGARVTDEGVPSPATGADVPNSRASASGTPWRQGEVANGHTFDAPAVAQTAGPSAPVAATSPSPQTANRVPEEASSKGSIVADDVHAEAAPADQPKAPAHDDWYQKWKLRQQEKSKPAAAPAEKAEPSSRHEERRKCPDDGKVYTFQELEEAYRKDFSAEDLRAYWRDAMKPLTEEAARPPAAAVAATTAAPPRPAAAVSATCNVAATSSSHEEPAATSYGGGTSGSGAGTSNATSSSAAQADPSKGHENEEWYQKWLRRQAHNTKKVVFLGDEEHARPEEQAPPAPMPPDDDRGHDEQPPEPSIAGDPLGQVSDPLHAESRPEERPYANEEWYQKWLRRQQSKPRPTNPIQSSGGDEASSSSTAAPPHAPAAAAAAAAAAAGEPGSEGNAGEGPSQHDQEGHREAEPERKPYENEEWYQKWLRRQKNKGRQIIEIGKPQPPPEWHEPPKDERRLCPDDQKHYSFDELQEAYGKEWSVEDLRGYWRDAMTLPAASGDDGAPSMPTAAAASEEEAARTPAETGPPERPYEQEEWYQKWLRRQQNKPRQIIQIG